MVVDAGGQDRVQLGGVGGEDPAPGWYYIYIYTRLKGKDRNICEDPMIYIHMFLTNELHKIDR